MSEQGRQPVHPGEYLLEIMDAMGLAGDRLAGEIGVPPRLIDDIAQGARGITAETALRLGRRFGTRPEWWLDMQVRYELDAARAALGGRLDLEVRRPEWRT